MKTKQKTRLSDEALIESCLTNPSVDFQAAGTVGIVVGSVRNAFLEGAKFPDLRDACIDGDLDVRGATLDIALLKGVWLSANANIIEDQNTKYVVRDANNRDKRTGSWISRGHGEEKFQTFEAL